jgi:hypothetical protein
VGYVCTLDLKMIDLDRNNRVSLIEYLLFRYKKTVTELFAEKPGNFAALLKQVF